MESKKIIDNIEAIPASAVTLSSDGTNQLITNILNERFGIIDTNLLSFGRKCDIIYLDLSNDGTIKLKWEGTDGIITDIIAKSISRHRIPILTKECKYGADGAINIIGTKGQEVYDAIMEYNQNILA